MSEELDYEAEGYNGYWDGRWHTTFLAHKALAIEDDKEAMKAFNKGWNLAFIEEKTVIKYDH